MAIISEQFMVDIQADYAASWACNCNADGQPDLVRLMGVQVEPDREYLIFFLPLPSGQGVIDNLAVTDKISFLFALLGSNASYQLKGTYVSHHPCTAAEVAFQRDYLTRFGDALERQGLSGEKGFRAYFVQPSVAIRMRVEEIYEQSPKQGTGEKIAG